MNKQDVRKIMELFTTLPVDDEYDDDEDRGYSVENKHLLAGVRTGDTRTMGDYQIKLEDSVWGDGDGSHQEVIFQLANTVTGEFEFVRYTGTKSSWDEDWWADKCQVVESRIVPVKKWFEKKED